MAQSDMNPEDEHFVIVPSDYEYWVIIPFSTKEYALGALDGIGYQGFVIRKPSGTYRTEINFRVGKE